MSDAAPFRQVRPPDRRDSVHADRSEERAFVSVLSESTALLTEEGIDHVVMGGVAVAALARPRWTHDVDLFVRPDDASRALQILHEAGYETEKTNPTWLFKGWKDDVLVDLIFRSEGGYYLDESILQRAQTVDFKGASFRVLPPEDLLVIKAAAHQEDAPYHWFDALALLARQRMDWDYLLERSRRAVRRVLSLLVYAESIDTAVPPAVIDALTRYEHGTAQTPLGSDRSSRGEADLEAESMRERLREHPAVGELDLELSIRGSLLVIEGEVTTAERRQQIQDAARELFPGRSIDNRLRVQDAEGDPDVEQL
ncbi:MAG: nucleotidyltransferase [Actinobacteria bacterium]|nr:nucleotidyltransferase [Actinomycetota bacterium]